MSRRLYDAATELLAAGMTPVPVHQDGTKRPDGLWKQYQHQQPTTDDLRAWFGPAASAAGLGLICGNISGGLEMVEVEGRFVHRLDDIDNRMAAAGLDTVWHVVRNGWVELSPSGGLHWFWLTGEPEGNKELALGEPYPAPTPGHPDGKKADVLIETRGEGGFVVTAPTFGRFKGYAEPVSWVRTIGGPSTIPTVNAEDREGILCVLATFDETPPKAVGTAPITLAKSNRSNGIVLATQDRPGDLYNNTTTWRELLEPYGWVYLYTDGQDITYWRRPGKTDGISATTNYGGSDLLKVFTSSAWPLEPDKTYDRFGAYVALEHGGDFRAAAIAVKPQPSPAPATYGKPTEATKGDAVDTPAQAISDRRIKLTPASQIGMKVAKWVWQDRIPQGALTLLGGREGIGKSTYAYDLAADITRGKTPGVFFAEPKAVLIAATEDSWEHTINPRLAAAGANRDIVYRIDVESVDKEYAILTLPQDMDALKDAVIESDAGLILLDPLLSRLDGHLDTHKDADVRKALEPITKLAIETNCAVVGLIHVNKGGSNDPLTALMGSRAFSAVARAVLFIMIDPDDEGVRLLGQPKNNLGRSDLPTLRFKIVNTSAGLADDGEEMWVGKLVWDGESDMTLSDALEMVGRPGPDPESRSAAADWLADYLKSKGGTFDSAEIRSAGKAAGHSDSTLKRAKAKLKVSHESRGFPRVTHWTLPAAAVAQSAHPTVSSSYLDPTGDAQLAHLAVSSSYLDPTVMTSPVGSPVGRDGEPELTGLTVQSGHKVVVSSSSSLPPHARANCEQETIVTLEDF